MSVKIKLIAHDHHRNGICGSPFSVALFEWDDDGLPRTMVGLLWEDEELEGCGVLDVNELAKGNVGFGSNSWRGDHFHDDLLAAIAKAKGE